MIYFLLRDFLKLKDTDGDDIEIILTDPQIQEWIWEGKHGYMSKGDIWACYYE